MRLATTVVWGEFLLPQYTAAFSKPADGPGGGRAVNAPTRAGRSPQIERTFLLPWKSVHPSFKYVEIV